MPNMTNETGKALKEFSNGYIAILQTRFGTEEADEA